MDMIMTMKDFESFENVVTAANKVVGGDEVKSGLIRAFVFGLACGGRYEARYEKLIMGFANGLMA